MLLVHAFFCWLVKGESSENPQHGPPVINARRGAALSSQMRLDRCEREFQCVPAVWLAPALQVTPLPVPRAWDQHPKGLLDRLKPVASRCK